MTDKTQELDEIINSAYEGEVSWTHDQLDGTSMVDDAIKGIEDEKAKTKQSLLDWHNKQTLELLDRLLEHGEDFTTFGDAGRSVAVEYIEAERNKLKESSND